MQLFYNPNISQSDKKITFNKEESRHITKVLRKDRGDKMYITNGKGWLFTSQIIIADHKNCQVEITESKFTESRHYKLHLAVAPTKMNDRFEWFLEKACEIGIDTITPIITANSERKSIKPERFERILQSAMKQSLQVYKPTLNNLITLNEFLSISHSGQRFIAHCDDQDKKLLQNIVKPNDDVVILVGPEGDFNSEEIELAISKDFKAVSLGENRLRTETAAIVACNTVAFVNQ